MLRTVNVLRAICGGFTHHSLVHCINTRQCTSVLIYCTWIVLCSLVCNHEKLVPLRTHCLLAKWSTTVSIWVVQPTPSQQGMAAFEQLQLPDPSSVPLLDFPLDVLPQRTSCWWDGIHRSPFLLFFRAHLCWWGRWFGQLNGEALQHGNIVISYFCWAWGQSQESWSSVFKYFPSFPCWLLSPCAKGWYHITPHIHGRKRSRLVRAN